MLAKLVNTATGTLPYPLVIVFNQGMTHAASIHLRLIAFNRDRIGLDHGFVFVS